MSRRLRLFRMLRLAALLAVLTFPPVATPTSRLAATSNVSIQNYQFNPQTIVVNVGDTIMWTNSSPSFHNVTADDNSFSSPDLAATKEFSHTFTIAGIFPYYCGYHGGPGGTGMSGVVVVGMTTAYLPLLAKTDAAQQSFGLDTHPARR